MPFALTAINAPLSPLFIATISLEDP